MDMWGNLVDVFSHRMPMGIAIFDNRLVLQRFNPTWVDYIEALTPSLEEILPGLSLADLLPEAAATIAPYAQQALNGETIVQDALRLTSQDAIFYWNTAFTPVAMDDVISGFSLVATDVTDRVLTQQLLERHVADRTRKLSALYDVMALAAEPAELREILQKSLARVLTAVQAQSGMIQLLDSGGEFLHLAVYQNMLPPIAEALQVTPAYDYLSGRLVRDWTPVVLKDVSAALDSHPLVSESGLHAYAGLQMNAKGRVVGVLSVFRARKRPFSQEDIALLDSVADQIGTAVENARLRKENEQLLVLEERNRLARELHDAVTQSLYSITLFAEANRRFAEDENLSMSAEYAARLGDTAQQALREM
ncbi:MAG: GAF domain-containing protein, partial [Anaerolineales bacterium]|nr:GAF domain-containing protein [Anaerolineales bacterium]